MTEVSALSWRACARHGARVVVGAVRRRDEHWSSVFTSSWFTLKMTAGRDGDGIVGWK